MKKIPVTCNKDCGGGCPLLAHVKDGRIVKITDNPRGTKYMTGCPRGFMGHLPLYSPERITTPLIRTGPRGEGSFRSASWEEAIEAAAKHLSPYSEKSGENRPEGMILHLGGSGACESVLHNTDSLAKRFLNLLGPHARRTGSYSSGAEKFAMPFVFGSEPYGMDPKTLLESALIILWGMNPADTIFGCELRGYLREAKKRGIPIIVIDPRKSRSVKQFSSQWIPINPGTDSVMMAAVLHTLISENLVDRPFLDTYTAGSIDGIAQPPAQAEKICGVPAGVIKDFACRYGRAKPAALLPGLSIQRTMGGEEACRMAVVLQAVTGNIGRAGGSSGGNIWGRLPGPRCGKIPKQERDDAITVEEYLWAEAVLRGRSGGFPADISAIYSVGGNYLNQGSDIKKNMAAFEKTEWVICHENFMTPSARWADIVFPSTLPLEREDIIHPPGNYLLYSAAASTPPEGVKDDWEVFRLISGVLGFEDEFTGGLVPPEWLARFLDESEIADVETFKSEGIYMAEDQERMGLSRFIQDPGAYPLDTPSGKIELSSETYAKTGYPGKPICRWFEPSPEYPLRLITPHARYRVNSQNFNIPWFRDRQDDTLAMNPADAGVRSIKSGDVARIKSSAGEVSAVVSATKDIKEGVVSLHQGVWFIPESAPRYGPPAPANLLTSTEPTMPSRSSRTHSTAVEVTPA